MSYTIHLYPKNQKVPFIEKELTEKFDIPYEIKLWDCDNASFDVMYIGGAPGSEIEFHFDVDHYITSCSYSEYLPEFKKIVLDVAKTLDLLIEDQQIIPLEKIDSHDYQINDPRSIQAVELVKKTLEVKNLNLLIPSPSKYFILYFIISENPTDQSCHYLLLEDGRLYASKVKKGEALEVVLNREILDLTGLDKYQLIQITHNYDTAPDKHGVMLPRTAITLKVPYFDTKTVKTKYPMKWVIFKKK